MSSTTMTIRLESEMKLRLDKLAKMTNRSKSFLVKEAINEFLKIHEWQLTEIKNGMSEANAGQFVDHESILEFWEDKED